MSYSQLQFKFHNQVDEDALLAFESNLKKQGFKKASSHEHIWEFCTKFKYIPMVGERGMLILHNEWNAAASGLDIKVRQVHYQLDDFDEVIEYP
ncbi:hypothetical protein [Pleionea sediminis]|uniref:hypothetical protein n=1 Tax=Pleionea sediminis TaxID=2569479 RepID=UPI001185ECF1|nr:hypothetical protein [Pleionea sediminis]